MPSCATRSMIRSSSPAWKTSILSKTGRPIQMPLSDELGRSHSQGAIVRVRGVLGIGRKTHRLTDTAHRPARPSSSPAPVVGDCQPPPSAWESVRRSPIGSLRCGRHHHVAAGSSYAAFPPPGSRLPHTHHDVRRRTGFALLLGSSLGRRESRTSASLSDILSITNTLRVVLRAHRDSCVTGFYRCCMFSRH